MVSNVYSKLATSTLSMQTSSCGRLFDAVSALLGLCEVAHYEGHAAVILEDCAGRSNIDKNIEAYSVRLEVSDIGGRELIEIDTTSIIEAIINNIEDGAASSEIAAKFHETIAELILETCSILRQKSGINVVCLSGGVFQNARLSVRTNQLLRANEFEVFTNQLVPANDGGLSLGQAAIALAKAGMMECSS